MAKLSSTAWEPKQTSILYDKCTRLGSDLVDLRSVGESYMHHG